MAGPLNHSPADILRHIIIVHGLGYLPSGSNDSDWPIFVDNEPDRPDNAVTLYNTVGRKNGRTNPDGEIQEQHGIQIRIRSAVSDVGYVQSRAIAVDLDENLSRESITVGSSTYSVKSFCRTDDIIAFGKDSPTPTKRSIHTFNGILTVRLCS